MRERRRAKHLARRVSVHMHAAHASWTSTMPRCTRARYPQALAASCAVTQHLRSPGEG